MPRHLWTPVWLFRLLWLVLPLITGPGLADALTSRSRAVQVVVSVGAWAVWAITLIAAAVPTTVTLTAVRVLGPAASAATVWAAFEGDGAVLDGVAIGVSLIAGVALCTPAFADAFVDGSSYGAERRVALRLPGSFWLPVGGAWAALAIAIAGPCLLLATQQWVAGVAAATVGLAVTAALVLRLHQLSRRWLVFVPAGIVVHDPIALSQPVLLQRALLARIGPAAANAVDLGATDLTGGALGLALELRSREPFSIGRRHGRATVDLDGIEAMLVTPGRPASTLQIAREQRLPVA